MAASRLGRSSTSPSTRSIANPFNEEVSSPRSKRARTRSPRSTRARVSTLPMCPAAPVTRIIAFLRLAGLDALSPNAIEQDLYALFRSPLPVRSARLQQALQEQSHSHGKDGLRGRLGIHLAQGSLGHALFDHAAERFAKATIRRDRCLPKGLVPTRLEPELHPHTRMLARRPELRWQHPGHL